jgi:homocysteine S-methyltransferase
MIKSLLDITVKSRYILAEGSIIERVRRSDPGLLHPVVENTPMIYTNNGRQALTSLYSGYLDIGFRRDIPMIVLTPSWRANTERIRKAGYSNLDEVTSDVVVFMRDLIDGYHSYKNKILLGGLTGCRGDSYNPKEALSREEAHRFHLPQAEALAKTKVDFLLAATLPALSEAEGIARAFADCDIPYMLSFVVRSNGNLLDGTPLAQAIDLIDANTNPRPTCYFINCVHPENVRKGLLAQGNRLKDVLPRLAGLQANASDKNPEELEGLDHMDADSPHHFAESMARLHSEFGIKILGGCCGTDEKFIEEIGKVMEQ